MKMDLKTFMEPSWQNKQKDNSQISFSYQKLMSKTFQITNPNENNIGQTFGNGFQF